SAPTGNRRKPVARAACRPPAPRAGHRRAARTPAPTGPALPILGTSPTTALAPPGPSPRALLPTRHRPIPTAVWNTTPASHARPDCDRDRPVTTRATAGWTQAPWLRPIPLPLARLARQVEPRRR